MQDVQTFLFADFVGYTALTDVEGDDRAADVALKLQRRIAALLAGYGGEQVKALGDGAMLRCSDPAAAVRLGLRNITEPIGTYSARERICAMHRIRAAASRVGNRPRPAARLEAA